MREYGGEAQTICLDTATLAMKQLIFKLLLLRSSYCLGTIGLFLGMKHDTTLRADLAALPLWYVVTELLIRAVRILILLYSYKSTAWQADSSNT